ncbi:hypothetical protein ACQUKE_25530, partial [Ralstonia pseudosolanacearum]
QRSHRPATRCNNHQRGCINLQMRLHLNLYQLETAFDTGTASNPSKSNVASGRYGGPYDAETPEADSQAARTTAGAANSGQPDQKGAASAGKGALPAETADEAHGSARGATIGGQHGSTKLEETLDKLVDHLSQPSKPKAGQQLRDLDQRLAHDKATVGVSINPHHD